MTATFLPLSAGRTGELQGQKQHKVTDHLPVFCATSTCLSACTSSRRRERFASRNTTCDVLLQLSRAVSACELQRAGVSALQQAGDQQIQARITGEVERVGEHAQTSPSSHVHKNTLRFQDRINYKCIHIYEKRVLHIDSMYCFNRTDGQQTLLTLLLLY